MLPVRSAMFNTILSQAGADAGILFLLAAHESAGSDPVQQRGESPVDQLRFSLLQAANTGLFIVYNETRDIEPTLFGIPGRSLAVKFSRIFDLFD